MKKFKNLGILSAGLALLSASQKLSATEAPGKEEFMKALGDAKEQLQEKCELGELSRANDLLRKGIKKLSSEEKNQLIIELLEHAREEIEFENDQFIKDEDYLDEMGIYSFGH